MCSSCLQLSNLLLEDEHSHAGEQWKSIAMRSWATVDRVESCGSMRLMASRISSPIRPPVSMARGVTGQSLYVLRLYLPAYLAAAPGTRAEL